MFNLLSTYVENGNGTPLKFGNAICYSGYRDGQNPHERKYPSYDEIREDLLILSKNWQYLRLYDCSPHAERVLAVIRNEGLDFKVMLGLDMGAEMAEALIDAEGAVLLDPDTRSVVVEADTSYRAGGQAIDPPPGTAAHAWRKLGLVDERGHPTRRGEIFSLLQAATAAASAAATV